MAWKAHRSTSGFYAHTSISSSSSSLNPIWLLTKCIFGAKCLSVMFVLFHRFSSVYSPCVDDDFWLWWENWENKNLLSVAGGTLNRSNALKIFSVFNWIGSRHGVCEYQRVWITSWVEMIKKKTSKKVLIRKKCSLLEKYFNVAKINEKSCEKAFRW